MTEKIFWQDPYLRELETVITTVNGAQITVAETIFYAFSGGQESDSGSIGSYTVLNAQKEGREIFYTLEDQHSLKVGDKVKILIDGERRYQLMRLHFAAEVILELVSQKFPEAIKVGAHMAADKARMDFKWNQNIKPFLPALEKDAQQIIDANQDIISAFSDEGNEIRYWQMPEFSRVPCGGTHIKKTGEVGQISLKRSNPGRGRERIEIFIHDRDNVSILSEEK